MIADFSGSMYVRPPAPPMRAAQKANGTPNKEVRVAYDLMPFPCLLIQYLEVSCRTPDERRSQTKTSRR